METSSIQKLSFKERYWLFENEKRVNRKQFIVRWLLLLITGMIVSYIVWKIIPSISMEDSMSIAFWWKISSPWFAISVIIGLVTYYPFYRMNKMLYVKRYADFNNNGKSPRVLLPIIFYGMVIVSFLQIIQAYVWSEVLVNWMLWLWEYFLLIIHGSTQLMIGAFICVFLMFIISIFTSGTPETNTYWENPKNNQII